MLLYKFETEALKDDRGFSCIPEGIRSTMLGEFICRGNFGTLKDCKESMYGNMMEYVCTKYMRGICKIGNCFFFIVGYTVLYVKD